jgi:hypothetical protein
MNSHRNVDRIVRLWCLERLVQARMACAAAASASREASAVASSASPDSGSVTLWADARRSEPSRTWELVADVIFHCRRLPAKMSTRAWYDFRSVSFRSEARRYGRPGVRAGRPVGVYLEDLLYLAKLAFQSGRLVDRRDNLAQLPAAPSVAWRHEDTRNRTDRRSRRNRICDGALPFRTLPQWPPVEREHRVDLPPTTAGTCIPRQDRQASSFRDQDRRPPCGGRLCATEFRECDRVCPRDRRSS